MDEVRRDVGLVVPAGAAAVEVLHDSRVTGEILDPDPYLAKGELPLPVLVEPPPVRVTDPVEAGKVRLYEIRVISE